MKATGLRISEMAKDLKGTLMAILTLVILRLGKHMEMGFIPGQMERCMMENGTKGLNMDMAYGKGPIMTLMSGSGA